MGGTYVGKKVCVMDFAKSVSKKKPQAAIEWTTVKAMQIKTGKRVHTQMNCFVGIPVWDALVAEGQRHRAVADKPLYRVLKLLEQLQLKNQIPDVTLQHSNAPTNDGLACRINVSLKGCNANLTWYVNMVKGGWFGRDHLNAEALHGMTVDKRMRDCFPPRYWATLGM